MKTVLCSLLLSTAAMATEGAGWTLHPGGPWQVSGSLKGKKDVSAIDLISSSTGLLASDEGSLVQAVRLDAALRTLTLGAAWPLLGPKQEADIEGIAAAPAENCYFVTGSHAISRKKMELEPSRFHIFRVRLNPATQVPSGAVDTATLRPLLESMPELKPFLDEPTTAHGIDIEGLAWREGKLFIGFRAPGQGEHAWVLETSVKAVFDGAPADGRLHALPVGRAIGIRALTPVREGFLFLSGDAGLDQSRAAPALYFWKPGAPPQKLGPVPAGGKPEALTVLSESDAAIELLMLSDGPVNGSPVGLQVKKSTDPLSPDIRVLPDASRP